MTGRKSLIAGNWKMNGTKASLAELDAMILGVVSLESDLAICPPATLLGEAVRRATGSALLIGAQDCHAAQSGAHTGDISAEMVADIGASVVIVGHSERRTDHGETDEIVKSKAEAGLRAGLLTVVCIGETADQRNQSETEAVLTRQLAGSVPDSASPATVVIAYEPVWAIGTGLTASLDDIAAAHSHIRARLEHRFGAAAGSYRILYGGSVKPSNAASILAVNGVDGALVGGASLKAEDFLAIASAR
jgi:triosephosphate isomerase